jgi:hypothetical protein
MKNPLLVASIRSKQLSLKGGSLRETMTKESMTKNVSSKVVKTLKPEEGRSKKLGWQHFLPPMIPFSVADKVIEKDAIDGIFKEFQKNVQTTLTRSGQKRKILLVIQSLISTLSYAFVEKMNKAVRNQQLYLLSQNQIPFLENTCCHDDPGVHKVIDFFNQKEPMLMSYISMSNQLDKGLEDLSVRASILFYVKTPIFPLEIDMRMVPIQNIMLAYIHYLYDMNLYDDPEIKTIIKVAEPTIEYRACISSQDKVKYFEKNNPDIGMNQGMFQQMMQVIHWRKRIPWEHPVSWEQKKKGDLNQLMEKLETWQEIEEKMDPFLPRLLQKVLESPLEEQKIIKNLELKADRLRQVLADQGFPQEVHEWKQGLDKRTIVQYYENSVYSLLRFYPAIISSRTSFIETKKNIAYWGFAKSHEIMIGEKEAELFRSFQPFLENKDFIEFIQISISLKMIF